MISEVPEQVAIDCRKGIISKFRNKFWHFDILRWYMRSMSNLRMRADDSDRLRLERLIPLVKHAKDTVPFYGRKYKDIDLSSIKSIDDIKRLPVIDKRMIIDLPMKERISGHYELDDLVHIRTGGSTGKCLDIYISKDNAKRRIAEGYRIYAMHGYKPTDKVAIAMFYPEEPDFLSRLGLLRKYFLPVDMDIAEQKETVLKIKPHILEGYPSRLSQIAKEIIMSGEEVSPPKAIFSNSETLTEAWREDIEKAFKTRVSNVYDCFEFGRVAWECASHDGLHLSYDSLIVEVLNGGGNPVKPGEQGRVVITDLHNFAMPFIRYAIGDIAIQGKGGECACGTWFPRLEEVLGRENDVLILPNGKSISSTALTGILKPIGTIKEFQIVQDFPDSLDISIVASKGYDKADDGKIARWYKERCGFSYVNVHHVKAIKRTQSAKLRSVICNIRDNSIKKS